MTQHHPNPPERYCSDCAREAGEQVFGTAPPVDVWLLLEYPGMWSRKAVLDNALPEAVRQRLNTPPDGIAMRPLLIRKPGRDGVQKACFVAVVDELAPRLYRFDLAAYPDLLDLDLGAIVTGAEAYEGYRHDGPLVLVCTNGRRDQACARYGQPVYREAAAVAGDAAWQSTHLGGHRFAAAALFLPVGVAYGYLAPGDMARLIPLVGQGRLDPALLRGRTCYSKPVQAAEALLRREIGCDALPGLRLVNVKQEAPDRWTVQFAVISDGRLHTLQITNGRSAVQTCLTSTDAELTTMAQYDVLSHTVDVS